MALTRPKTFEEKATFFEENQDLFSGYIKSGLAGTLNYARTEEGDNQSRFIGDFNRIFDKTFQGFNDAIQQSQDKISKQFSDFANKTDFSRLTPEAAAKELQALSGSRQTLGRFNSIESNIAELRKFGLEDEANAAEQSLNQLKTRISGNPTELAGTQFQAAGLTLDPSTGEFSGSGEAGTADIIQNVKQANAAQAQAEIERAAGIDTQIDPRLQKFLPTPVDNVVDAREFVNDGTTAEVGGTPPLSGGTPSPIFTDPNNPGALFYIPPGSDTPIQISNPEQLQQLAAQGLIQVNQERIPLDQASTFLQGQIAAQQAAATAGGGGGGVGAPAGGGTVAGPGGITELAQQVNAAIQPFNQQILDLQATFLGFEPTDLSRFRQELEAQSGLNNILNELSNVDTAIAELIGIERRVPETTLERAKGTEIAQATLDRQRTIELQKLSVAIAPLTDLKGVLQDDLERRMSLIDEAVDLQREQDSFKLETIGFALDFAMQNRGMAEDEAERIFASAVGDYELALQQAEAMAEAQRDAMALEAELLADFYKQQGYVINPQTGELAETLALKKYIGSTLTGSRGGGGGGGKVETSQVDDVYTLMFGGNLTNVAEKDRPGAIQGLIEIKNSGIQGPFQQTAGFNPTALADQALTRIMNKNVEEDDTGPIQFE